MFIVQNPGKPKQKHLKKIYVYKNSSSPSSLIHKKLVLYAPHNSSSPSSLILLDHSSTSYYKIGHGPFYDSKNTPYYCNPLLVLNFILASLYNNYSFVTFPYRHDESSLHKFYLHSHHQASKLLTLQ